ncbi:MAG TPA: hypothetical protein VGM43_14260 [Bryobacteraceae bacterium]
MLCAATLAAQSGGRGGSLGGIIGGGRGGQQNGPPTPSDCAASGIVVNAVSGAPIPRAMVQGNPGGTATDAKGEWSITNQRCVLWVAQASRPGFFNGMDGVRGAGTPKSVALTSGSPVTGIRIELTPEAIVSGTVLNADGDPVAQAQIRLMRAMVVNGYLVLTGAQNGNTDQQGNFRIDHLQPGRFIACAGSASQVFPVGGGEPLVYPEACYPGPPDQGPSVAMPLDAGKEARISLTLRAQQAVHVRGVVQGAGGGRGNVNLMKVASDEQRPGVPAGMMVIGMVSSARPGQIQRDGTFDIANVAPGNYIATARIPMQGGGGPGRGMAPTATARITVGNSDVNGIQLTLQPPAAVNGTVRYDLADGPPAPQAQPANGDQQFQGRVPGVTVNLMPAQPGIGGAGQLKWDDSHLAFNWPEVQPGSYTLNARVAGIPGAYVKSATLRGQDVLTQSFPVDAPTGPIEIVVSDDAGTFQANVVDADGHPAAAGIVLKPASGRPLTGRAGDDGVATIQSVPSGEYSAWAFDNISQVPWNEGDWMAQHAGSPIHVTISKTAAAAPVTMKRITAPAL